MNADRLGGIDVLSKRDESAQKNPHGQEENEKAVVLDKTNASSNKSEQFAHAAKPMKECVPFDLLFKYAKVAMSVSKCTTVLSVGSGNGFIEYALTNRFKAIQQFPKIICIDPEPESFHPYHQIRHHKPEYASVKDYLLKGNNDEKEANKRCLFLHWPTPNASTFDYEAIELLRPTIILLVYEQWGGAGGTLLHNFLNCVDWSYVQGWVPSAFYCDATDGQKTIAKEYVACACWFRSIPNWPLEKNHKANLFNANRDGIVLFCRRDAFKEMNIDSNNLPTTVYEED